MDQPQRFAPPPRYTSIDLVRGITALAVVLSHIAVFYPQSAAEFPAFRLVSDAVTFLFARPMSNHPGVLAFIVLSGFCIHLPVARANRADGSPGAWSTFYARRLLRLAPTYVLATFAGAGLVAWAAGTARLQVASLEFSPPSWMAVANRLTFLEAWHRLPGQELGNGPLRTVATEMWLYALYPLVLLGRRIGGRPGMGVVGLGAFLLASIPAAMNLPDGGAFSSTESVPRFLGFWVTGAIAAEVLVERGGPALSRQAWRLSGLLFAANFALNHLSTVRGTWVVVQPIFGAAIAGLLVAVVNEDRLRTAPPSEAVQLAATAGAASYTLYAVHIPVMSALAMVARAMGSERIVASGWFQLAALFAVGLVTWAAFLLVERPAHVAAQALGRRAASVRS